MMAWQELATVPPVGPKMHGFYRPVDNTIITMGAQSYNGVLVYSIDDDEWEVVDTMPAGMTVTQSGPKVAYDVAQDIVHIFSCDPSIAVPGTGQYRSYSSNSLETRDFSSYSSSTGPLMNAGDPYFYPTFGTFVWHKFDKFYIGSSEITDTVVNRRSNMALLLGEEFFIFAGIDEGDFGAPAMNIEKCTIGEFSFSMQPISLPVSDYWFNASTSVYDGVGYVAGGMGTTDFAILDNVYSFDGTSFTALEPLPSGRVFPTLVATPDGLYCIGGQDPSFEHTVTNYFLPFGDTPPPTPPAETSLVDKRPGFIPIF